MSDIKIICGLGNPGEEYEHTRHNCGFMVVHELYRRANFTQYWQRDKSGAMIASGELEGKQILFAMPFEFMNTSGNALSRLCKARNVLPDEVLVVHDELDIPCGDVRLKVGGGHAGHNGLRSIIDRLGTKDFYRLRIGIGRPPGRMPVANFVLARLRGEEAELIEEAVMKGADAAMLALKLGMVRARDEVNRG